MEWAECGAQVGEAGQRTWNVVAAESFHLQFKDLFCSFFIDGWVFFQLMHIVFFNSCHFPLEVASWFNYSRAISGSMINNLKMLLG